MSEEHARLEQAARAAWLAHVGGLTQDEIARNMGISRQAAQRLVAQAQAAGIVKVRIDHPLTACLNLGAALRDRFGLRLAGVAPSGTGLAGVARAVADMIERELARPEPITLAVGTGRTLRAAVEQMGRIDCPRHRIVSLSGNIAPDGSAAYFNVLFSLSELVTARSFPLMVPVIAANAAERAALHRQPGNIRVMQMAAGADTAIVGLGTFGPDAPLRKDGFLTAEEIADRQAAGAVGEILGHAYTVEGAFLPQDDRVASAPLPDPGRALVAAAAWGEPKREAMLGALRTGRLNAIFTDEDTAAWLLDRTG